MYQKLISFFLIFLQGSLSSQDLRREREISYIIFIFNTKLFKDDIYINKCYIHTCLFLIIGKFFNSFCE